MKLGIDRLLQEEKLRHSLNGQRVALMAHPASVTSQGQHSLDALFSLKDLKITCCFGPQHGMRGEKQYNMIETDDYLDPQLKIPVFSLYGKTRRPSPEMLREFDVLLIDLQDIGTRIYTYLTTTCYMLEACAQADKRVWILDRPNPAGRTIEGSYLESGHESFVGIAPMIIRHGLTLGEAALWYKDHRNLKVDVKVIEMRGYEPLAGPGFGWPLHELAWVNPSPNAASLNMVRCFPGTVLLEGTHLSEGRGTTVPLEIVGAPDLPHLQILKKMAELSPQWMEGAIIRPCHFQPTFYKHQEKICAGFQIHTDFQGFNPQRFHAHRLIALFLKSLRLLQPDFPLWRDFEYEYERDRLAIDVINGGPLLRQWVDDSKATISDLENVFRKHEKTWAEEREPYLIY